MLLVCDAITGFDRSGVVVILLHRRSDSYKGTWVKARVLCCAKWDFKQAGIKRNEFEIKNELARNCDRYVLDKCYASPCNSDTA